VILAGRLRMPLDGNPWSGRMITKDPCTYKIRILRHEKSLRDHGDMLGHPM